MMRFLILPVAVCGMIALWFWAPIAMAVIHAGAALWLVSVVMATNGGRR